MGRLLTLVGTAILLAGCALGPDDEDFNRWEAEKLALEKRAESLGVEIFKVSTDASAGYDIAVLRNDASSNRRVITIPGAPSEHIYWTGFAANISKEIEFYVIERPGYGASGPGAPVTDLEEQSDAVTAVLNGDTEGCNIVMGSSYGAAIALLTALREPGRVDGIIVISGLMQRPARGARVLSFAGTVLSPFIDYGDLEIIRREVVNAPAQRRRILNRLGEVTVPVTIVHGEDDNLVEVSNAFFLQEKLQGITDVDLMIVPGGHELMINTPEVLYEAIDRNITRVKNAGRC